MGHGRFHQSQEQWMGPGGTALEFGMVLYPHKEGPIGELRRFHQRPVGGDAGEGEPGFLEPLSELIVELVPVTVPLRDGIQSVILI